MRIIITMRQSKPVFFKPDYSRICKNFTMKVLNGPIKIFHLKFTLKFKSLFYLNLVNIVL